MKNIVKVLLCTIIMTCGSAGKSAIFLNFNGSTGVFGNDLVSSPIFSDSFDLGGLGAGQYLISATISSSYQAGAQADQDIDFTSVTLNDLPFVIDDSGQFEFRFITNVVALQQNLFKIAGTSGSSSSYAGTINVATVPEPSTWAMLMLGFGLLGYAMRRARGSERHLRRQML